MLVAPYLEQCTPGGALAPGDGRAKHDEDGRAKHDEDEHQEDGRAQHDEDEHQEAVLSASSLWDMRVSGLSPKIPLRIRGERPWPLGACESEVNGLSPNFRWESDVHCLSPKFPCESEVNGLSPKVA